MKHRYNQIQVFLALAILAGLSNLSCRRAVEVPPPDNSLIGKTVFTDNKTALAVMTGAYNTIHTNFNLADGTWSIGQFMATAADETDNYFIGVAATQFYTNQLSSNPGTYFWSQLFNNIYVANTVLQGVAQSTSLSTSVKNQLLGEAYFVRAFMNFYGVTLYGDFPIVTSTDYRINNVLSRSPQRDVYTQIVADLLKARTYLGDGYLDSQNAATTEKIRPNKAAATALLARVYLYQQDWTDAEAMSTEVINTAGYHLCPDPNQVFLKNSDEAIWQLASADPSFTNTIDGYYYKLTAAPGIKYHAAMSQYLQNAFEDKSTDLRYIDWVHSFVSGTKTYYYPLKYKNSQLGSPVTEYFMVLRLAEVYLIRAEARAQQSNPQAADDLNAIRNRAGLPDYSGALTPGALLDAVMHERQVELFTEWGHRWFDLKRTGRLDALMQGPTGVTAAKGGSWAATDTLLPLPLSEILTNPNLTQNAGYN